ncbi:hypothetical protein ACFYTF_16890 [Nocardia thailandica]|uniref:DUF3168 domain-containing protein n=1 Tax=Nocardia thailandica TaxID=257275 RepID=A0ABW6PQ99_9NOCA
MEDDRGVWEFTVGLGRPDLAGPDAPGGTGIHPVALALEAGVHRIDGTNRIPCYTSFGPIPDIDEFAQRAWGGAYDPARTPIECRLSVYVDDALIDELIEAIISELDVDQDGWSKVAGRKVVIGMRAIDLDAPSNSAYRGLVSRYQDQLGGR